MLIHIYNRINNHWLILATLSANIDHTKYMASMLRTNFFSPNVMCHHFVSLPMAIVHAAKWPLVKPEVASRNGTRQTTRNDVIYCRQLESFKQISMIIIIIGNRVLQSSLVQTRRERQITNWRHFNGHNKLIDMKMNDHILTIIYIYNGI